MEFIIRPVTMKSIGGDFGIGAESFYEPNTINAGAAAAAPGSQKELEVLPTL